MLRRRKWIRLPWATIIRPKQKNTSPKKVRAHLHLQTVDVSVGWLISGWFCSDYSAGFGGRYGVQADRMDKVSMNTG